MKTSKILLAIILISSIFQRLAFAEQVFSDLPVNHWAEIYFQELKTRQIFTGDEQENTIRPADLLNRAEALAIVWRAAELETSDRSFQNYFQDVQATDWFREICESAFEKDGVQGYSVASGREFRPAQAITRAEFVSLVQSVFNLKLKSEADFKFIDLNNHWAREDVRIFWQHEIVSGRSKYAFGPDESIARAEAAKVLYGVLMETQNGAGEEEGEGEGEGKGEEEEVEERPVVPGGGDDNVDALGLPEDFSETIVPGEWALAGKYYLKAGYEPLRIQKLAFDISGDPYDYNFSDIILLYPDDKEDLDVLNTQKSGQIRSEQVRFDNLDFVIPKQGTVEVRVFVKPNSIDNAAESGAQFEFVFTAENEDEFKAIGEHSQVETSRFSLRNSDSRILALRKSYPRVQILSEDGYLAFGDRRRVFEFQIAADKAGEISFKRLTLSVWQDGLTLDDDWELYSLKNPDKLLAEAELIDGQVQFDLTAEEEIAADDNEIYFVTTDLEAFGADSEGQLSVNLLKDQAASAGDWSSVSSSGSYFIWSDCSDLLHSADTADWTNSYYLSDFSTDYRSLNRD